MSEETVTITKSEYDSLLKDCLWLQCLESAGIDNWPGIDLAQDLYHEEVARLRG